LYVTERKDCGVLAKHHKTDSEIWLVYYRKETGKPRISTRRRGRSLCYGWIDSTVHKLYDERFAQRFRREKRPAAFPNRTLSASVNYPAKENDRGRISGDRSCLQPGKR